ncbi:reverse transcriptase domain-containing protein [Tanacetum coccineum]
MYTRGRKKVEAEPAPPARDPRDVETIERLQQRIQELKLQQLQPDSPAEEAETKPNDHVNKRRRIEGKSKVETWEKMKKLMTAKFLLENHRQEAFLDYHNLSKQNMTMEEVINKFDKLRMRCDVVEEEEQVVARFLGVLKPEIADIFYTPPTRPAPPTAPKSAPKATTPTTSAAGNTRERVDNARHCYKCSGLGHYVRDCPNPKTLAFRVLNVAVSKSVDDASWLRNNIFRTKCTSKGKLCDMIIDGGSYENVVIMYTHGRKKAEAEPTPPARDPRDVETIERLQQRIQKLKLQQLHPDSPAEEAKTEPNVWDDKPVDVNPFGGRKHRSVNHLYQPRRNDHVVDRDDRYRDDPICSLGLKIEIPEFTGKVHLNDFIDWLSTVERVVDVRDIPDKLKVKLVAIKLRQPASIWWDHNMTMEEVINEFDILQMRCDVVEEEEQFYAGFLGVLKPEIADIVSLQPYWTYTDVCKLALKVEKHIKAKSKGSNSRFTSRYTPPTRFAPPTAPK